MGKMLLGQTKEGWLGLFVTAFNNNAWKMQENSKIANLESIFWENGYASDFLIKI